MDLAREQSARFATIEPMLPPFGDIPQGERLSARLPDGREVFGMLYRGFHDLASTEALWSPRETLELTPILGGTGGTGMHALLRAWRTRLRRDPPGADSACVLTWPSRDAEVIRVLLDHGFIPESALAVRGASVVTAPGATTVRPAGLADLEELVELELAELRYAASVGMGAVRENAAALLEPGARSNLAEGRVWLAESDGVATGMVSCRWVSQTDATFLAGRIPDGRWGCINTLSVAPDARGRGVGRALMSVAHRELNVPGVRGTFLIYNPINPLSSVFWHRQGYRPLWTTWDVRPASALR